MSSLADARYGRSVVTYEPPIGRAASRMKPNPEVLCTAGSAESKKPITLFVIDLAPHSNKMIARTERRDVSVQLKNDGPKIFECKDGKVIEYLFSDSENQYACPIISEELALKIERFYSDKLSADRKFDIVHVDIYQGLTDHVVRFRMVDGEKGQNARRPLASFYIIAPYDSQIGLTYPELAYRGDYELITTHINGNELDL